jgi:hypothetical protein
MNRRYVLLFCLLSGAPSLAAAPQPKAAERKALPCQPQSPQRKTWPNGTLLWGSMVQTADKEMSTVLASLDLKSARLNGATLKGLRLEDGRLVAPAAPAPEGLAGATLQGAASDGQPVEVAVCGAKADANDASLVRYSIEVWDAESGSWTNPCIPTNRVPEPKALAVRGIWDEKGAHSDSPGKFTFACENGAIAKCIDWGYKPWANKEGRSLQDLHQACTRMLRADYCGDGRSHTREQSVIDMYDGLQILTRTTQASRAWDPANASFEAAWSPDGASCLARTRDGQALETVLAQCPEHFEPATKDLGQGDHCTVQRKGGGAEKALLRNHAYGKAQQARVR